MLAVDTNVVVRYVVNDDARQAERARLLIDRNPVFIPLSVVLESEWVLRSVYGFPFHRIAEALRTLAGQPTIEVERAMVVHTAIGLGERGIDFADALHLAASRHCEAFVSFDRDLADATKHIDALDVRQP